MSKRERIRRENARVRRARERAPMIDRMVGVCIIGFGFAVGPPALGLLFGVPLILISFVDRCYREPDSPYMRAWTRSLKRDMECIKAGQKPIGTDLRQSDRDDVPSEADNHE